ncbi:MAG: hypothetical protein WCS69_12010 [Ignavibacteriaceae bacterium]|jgi:hypothetical protein
MIKYILTIPLLFLLLSCEKSQIVDNGAASQEVVVVNCELDAGKLFSSVTFTRTLPVGIPYDIKAAELKDVKAYLKINGAQIVPLHYISNGEYKPMYNELIVEAGSTFELFAEWGETIIYSTTTIPTVPEINSASYEAGGKNLKANIKVHAGEVYGAIWVIGNGIAKATAFPSLSIPEKEIFNINVITSGMPAEYTGNEFNGMRNIQVFSYDKQYTAYFNSAKVNVPLGNAFMQNGGTIGWNVFGNNVIGMFIGVGKGTIKNVN